MGSVLVTLLLFDNVSEKNHHKKQGLILGRGFSPWSDGPIAFRPVERQEHCGGSVR